MPNISGGKTEWRLTTKETRPKVDASRNSLAPICSCSEFQQNWNGTEHLETQVFKFSLQKANQVFSCFLGHPLVHWTVPVLLNSLKLKIQITHLYVKYKLSSKFGLWKIDHPSPLEVEDNRYLASHDLTIELQEHTGMIYATSENAVFKVCDACDQIISLTKSSSRKKTSG